MNVLIARQNDLYITEFSLDELVAIQKALDVAMNEGQTLPPAKELLNFLNSFIDAPSKPQCSCCQNVFPQIKMLYGPDPYYAEINDDYRPVWLCEDCYDKSAGDV